MRPHALLTSACAAAALAVAPAVAQAHAGAHGAARAQTGIVSGGGGLGSSGPVQSTPVHPMVAGNVARIISGVAFAPSYAPPAVQNAIWAGNRIRHKPYISGGGHGRWASPGYDCSGSVSYVLHAAGLLKTSEDSGEMEDFGESGPGQWITIYANADHAFVEIAGVRLDTSAEDDPHPPAGTGPRWRPLMDGPQGYVARHPAGY